MPDSKFCERLEKGKQFEDELELLFSKNLEIKAHAKNGTEHTHPDFVAHLRQIHTDKSKMIRFAPDGIILWQDNDITYYEAKNSVCIEKDSYETLVRYYFEMSIRIMLFCKKNDCIYWRWVDEIVWQDPRSYDKVRNDGWIKNQPHRTPFKRIDLNYMNKWPLPT